MRRNRYRRRKLRDVQREHDSFPHDRQDVLDRLLNQKPHVFDLDLDLALDLDFRPPKKPPLKKDILDRRAWRMSGIGRRIKDVYGRDVSRETLSRERDMKIRIPDEAKALVCEERKEARRALFAIGKAGKGKAIKGRRKLTETSDIICERKKR